MDLHPRRYLLSWLLVIAASLVGSPNTPLYSQEPAKVSDDPGEPTSKDGETSDDAKKEDGKGITPPEYVGPARPREASYAFAQLKRAHQLLQANDWAKGFGILDGLLAEDPAVFADGEEPEPEPIDEIDLAPAGEAVVVGKAGAPRPVVVKPGGGRPPEPQSPKAVPPGQVVITADGIHYATLSETVRRVVLTLPAEARDVYQKTYGPPARRQLEEAVALPFHASLSALRDVAIRYPLTEAARDALGILGDRALDLGLAARAADAYGEQIHAVETLSAAGSPRAAPALRRSLLTLLAKLLLANRESGRDSEADLLAQRIEQEFRATTISLGGRAFTGTDLLKEPFARAQAESTQGDRLPAWPCAMGTPNHVAPEVAENALPPLGSRADWIHSFSRSTSEPAATERRSSRRLNLGQRFPLRQTNLLAAYPGVQVVTKPGMVLVRSGGELVAINASTGKILWRSNLEAVGSSVALFHPTPTNVAGVFRNRGGSSITLVGNLAIIIDAQRQPKYDRQGNLSYGSNALFAFDVNTGKLRWRVGGATGHPESLRTYSFTAPPTDAGGNLLVTPATQNDGPSIVALTTGGKVRWVEKLYNYNAGYLRQHRNTVSQGASLAVASGIAISAPGHGIVAAVEVETGRIRWLTRYPTLNVAERGPTIWAPAHPVVSGRRVIVAPQDSTALLTLDLDTGETLWERRYADDRYQLLGAVDKVAFVVGDRVEAIDIETNEPQWISDPIEYSAGRGFATRNRLYVPLENAIAVLDTKTGRMTQRVGFTDPRLTGLKPANLAIVTLDPAVSDVRDAEDSAQERSVQTRLIAMGGWGVAAVEPQGATWARADSSADSKSFTRARLLLSDSRYDEALALLESLLDASRSDVSMNTARTLIVDTARKAARSQDDPLPISRILERPDLVPDAAGRISLKFELAKLLEKSNARAAAELYHEIRAQTVEENIREPLFTPDNVLASADHYAADSLHLLGADGVVERAVQEEQEAASSILAALELLRGSDPAQRRRAYQSFKHIAFQRPYLPSAAKALSHLTALVSSEGELSETAGYLQRLTLAYPKLRKDVRVRSLRHRFDAALESTPTLPDSLAIGGKKAGLAWEKVFWKGVDDGVLVESVSGGEPLREIFTLRAGGLHVFGAQGETLGTVDLPAFPDLETVKAALKSHIEEPAQIFVRGGEGYLFSAAGLYSLELSENPFAFDEPRKVASDEGDDNSDSDRDLETATDTEPRRALPTLGWRQTYEHAIERLHRNSPRRRGLRSLRRVNGNLFPSFVVRNEGEEAIVLESDGGFFGINLTSGKIRQRVSGGGHTPLGPPKLRGTELVSVTTRPGGVVVYDLGAHGSSDQKSTVPAVKFKRRSSAQQIIHAAVVPKVAVVVDTALGVLVESYDGNDTLWRTRSTRYLPTLARVNAAHVWIVDPRGKLRCHALMSGRVLWEVSVPRRSMPVAQFETTSKQRGDENPGEEGEKSLWVALMTEGRTARQSYSSSMTENGKSLHLVKITEDGRKLAEVTIGGKGVTYLGQRWTVGDLWLLVYNQAGENGVWTSRATSFDPETGDYEVLFAETIAGKGTGLAPRLALVQTTADGELALAFGNSEGFGLFRPRPIQAAEPAGSDGKTPEGGTSNGTITEGKGADGRAK